MKTKNCKIMTSQLRHIIAIKLNEKEFYPKYLSEWVEVYFYSLDSKIKEFAMNNMKLCNQLEDNEIWEKLYFENKDKYIKELAFKMLPSGEDFNKEFIFFKNSLVDLSKGINTIIPRYSLLHSIEMLEEMFKNFKTLDELIIILLSSQKMIERVDIFSDNDLKLEIYHICETIESEILKYIALCEYDFDNDFLLKNDNKKLGLLDINKVYKKIPNSNHKNSEVILKIIKEKLKRNFNDYIKLYQNNLLAHDISEIIFSKLESSEPTLKELVELFEGTKDSGSSRLRDYSLKKIVEISKND